MVIGSPAAPLKLIIFQPSPGISFQYSFFTWLRLQNSSFSGSASDPGKLSFCQQPTSGKKWPPVGPAIFFQSSSQLLPPIARLVPRVQILAADISAFT